MRKRVIIYTIILITGFFISCGGGGGGGGGSDAGGESGRKYTLTASVVGGNGSVTPASGTYDEGAVVSLNASPADGYQVKAWSGTDDDTSKNNTNTVTMNANRTVTVEFQSVNAGNISREQAQDVLYAAYAGIGYNTVKSDTDDDEALYNVMFNDLNSLVGNFINELFLKKLTIDKILMLASVGQTFEFSTLPDGISSAGMKVNQLTNVKINTPNQGDFSFDFHAELKVNFNSVGYAYNNVIYKGSTTDFEATMDGSVKAEGVLSGSKKVTPSFNPIKITAHDTLSAEYSGYSVQYKEWNISYALKDDTYNLYIAPIIGEALKPGDYIDIRNYKLDGNFDINKNGMHSYYMNVQYGQLDLDFNYGGGKFIALTGDVSVPSLGGQKVSVNSAGTEMLTGNILNLISGIISGQVNINDFIRRNDNGTWTRGKLKIKPVNSEITATFNNDGSVQFPDGPAVANWQDALDPVK
jgi:hypothetical protein